MKFVYGSTILVMLAMAIFGAFGAAHGMEHGGGCFVATAAGMPCMADLAESLNMHFNILRSFSTAVFVLLLTVTFFVLLAYVLVAFACRRSPPLFYTSVSLYAIRYTLYARVSRWLSRLEHSPSFLFG